MTGIQTRASPISLPRFSPLPRRQAFAALSLTRLSAERASLPRMIGRLLGMVLDRSVDGSCIVEAGGVGYEVFLPHRALAELPEPPQRATLHIHTHVREEALTLYGFTSLEDRTAFRALLGVGGVGPKLALAILGELSAHELALAVARGDNGRLKGISGVGRKTAERLVLDLRDKLPAAAAASQSVPSGDGATQQIASDVRSVVAGALVQMGFGRGEAERAVTSAARSDTELSVEALLRKALAELG